MTAPGPFSPGDRVVWRSAISKPLPGATRAPAPYARAGRVTDQQGTHVWVAFDDTREIVQLFAYGGTEQHVWAEADYLTLSEQDPVTFPPAGAR